MIKSIKIYYLELQFIKLKFYKNCKINKLTKSNKYDKISKLVYSGNTNIVIGRDRSHESTSDFRMHGN